MDKPVNKYISLAQQINEHLGCKGSVGEIKVFAQRIEKLGELTRQVVEGFEDKMWILVI